VALSGQLRHKRATTKSEGIENAKAQNRAQSGISDRGVRRQIRSAARERGFRSEQAFILAACENELKRVTVPRRQLSSRPYCGHPRKCDEGTTVLFTLAHTQFALTNSLLQYVLTCVVEPPEDVLPAARAGAKARYAKILRHTAQEVATRNKATLEEVLSHAKQQ